MISRYVSSADTASPRALNVVAKSVHARANRALVSSASLSHPSASYPSLAVRKHATASSNAPAPCANLANPHHASGFPSASRDARNARNASSVSPTRSLTSPLIASAIASPPSSRAGVDSSMRIASAHRPARTSARAASTLARVFKNRPNLLSSSSSSSRVAVALALALALASSHRALQSSLDARETSREDSRGEDDGAATTTTPLDRAAAAASSSWVASVARGVMDATRDARSRASSSGASVPPRRVAARRAVTLARGEIRIHSFWFFHFCSSRRLGRVE